MKVGEKLVPSNIASMSGISSSDGETLIGGTLQGRKQFSPLGASRVSKQRMWQFALSIAVILCKNLLMGLNHVNPEKVGGNEQDEKMLSNVHPIVKCLKSSTYGEIKDGPLLEERRRVKREVREMALKGWVRNSGGEDFTSDESTSGK